MMPCEIATEKTELTREAGGGMCPGSPGRAPTFWQLLSWAARDFGFGHRHQTLCCT